ncbi:MFS transporter [Clostridium sp. YIM B02515]|uniref:MFS transporter n=1 Tax=Clostridium rhizosphaerae TaxID=2803861 RepID=A0ABS1TG48_9CLOT|nr:MFS transporter [Clostridium rhizosphaerae]MBL4936938.1 MFS transporter [Clostridium rhizosphaerae]
MAHIKKLKSYGQEYSTIIKNSILMRIIAAGFISSLGSKISYFALLRKVYILSNGKITDLGFLTIMEALPYMLFGAFAGIIIDKLPRKWIMAFSDIMCALVVISLIFVNDLKLIYIITFLKSSVYVFRNPAQSAMEPNLVNQEDVPLLNSFESSVNSITQIIGSALGAAVVGFVGVKNAFIIDSASFIVSAVIIGTIFVKEEHVHNNKMMVKGRYLREFVSGISIMWKDGSLKLMLLIDLFVTFAMAMQAPLIYIFLKETLKLGDRAELIWGILLSSLGVGAIFGSLVIGILVKRYKNRFKLFLNILLFDSVFFTMFILNRVLLLSVAIFAFLGCIGTAHMIILNTVIQNTASDEHRGKVFSTFAMLRSPISIISILIGTTAAEFISARNVLLIVAGIEALIALGVRLTSTYRSFDRNSKGI